MEKRANPRSLIQQQNLKKIHAAVDKLINEVGFENMTVRQICEEAGVSNGTFYYNFKSKDDLIRDRYFQSHSYFEQLYENELTDLAPLEALKILVSEQEKHLMAWSIPTLSCYMKASLTEMSKWQESQKHSFMRIAFSLFARGQAEGTIKKDHTPEQLTDMLYCIIIGITFRYCSTNGSVLTDGVVYDQLKEWLEGLRQG